MRICLFTPNFLPAIGGEEIAVDALARQFVARGHHVVVLTKGRPTPLQVPYEVLWHPKPRLFPRWYPERIARHLRRAHARHRFDIFAVNYAQPTGYAALRVGQDAGVPVVITSHGGDLYRATMFRKHPHLWRRTEIAYRRADGLIAISPYIEQLIREINPQPRCIEVIPNGMDPTSVTAPATRPTDFDLPGPFCLALGNLRPLKGFADAIEAWALARPQLAGLTLVIAGAGPEEADLRRRIAALGLEQVVRLIGARYGNDKRWLLQQCVCGIMPSHEEGHPLVALEFLAAGKPLICTDNPSFDGMYDHGVNAVRVPVRQPAALAQALARIPALDLAAMGAVSRERIGRYDWSLLAEQTLGFYARVIEQHRSTP